MVKSHLRMEEYGRHTVPIRLATTLNGQVHTGRDPWQAVGCRQKVVAHLGAERIKVFTICRAVIKCIKFRLSSNASPSTAFQGRQDWQAASPVAITLGRAMRTRKPTDLHNLFWSHLSHLGIAWFFYGVQLPAKCLYLSSLLLDNLAFTMVTALRIVVATVNLSLDFNDTQVHTNETCWYLMSAFWRALTLS